MNIDDWIDETMEWFNDRFNAGDFEAADIRLAGVNVSEMTSTQIVAFLTCSLWAKDKLLKRPEFVKRCRAQLEKIKPDTVEALMRGLE